MCCILEEIGRIPFVKKLGFFVCCAAKTQLRQKGVINFISVWAKHWSKSDQPTP